MGSASYLEYPLSSTNNSSSLYNLASLGFNKPLKKVQGNSKALTPTNSNNLGNKSL